MPRHVALVVNPTAHSGHGAAALLAVSATLAASGITPQLIRTPSPGEAIEACRRAVSDGVEAIVAMGGDGTVHHALQAVAGTGRPFGIIPTGTGNDLAVELGIPSNPVAAAQALADCLRTGRTTSIDAIRLAGPDRWVASVVSAGFDSAVNERANRMRWPRGPRRYDLAIFMELIRLTPREFTIELDGSVWRTPAILVTVGNTASYGGGLRICPDADATDGLLDVTVVGPVSRTELVKVKPRLRTGTHVAHPKVHTRRAKRVGVSASGVTSYGDGEPLAPLPIELTCVPGALRILA